MSTSSNLPAFSKLDLNDVEEDLFASPGGAATTNKQNATPSTSHANQRTISKHAQQESREAQLRAELERIRQVNKVVQGITASLTKAKSNMETVNRTVDSASTLLATWTRILSQTEHNQRLILNPTWQGASQDMEDMENEELRRQQEAERRAMEEQRRREEAQRKAEDGERRRMTTVSASSRVAGRSRGVRGSAGSSRGTASTAGRSTRGRGVTGGTRGGSGILRSSHTSRGRDRGVG